MSLIEAFVVERVHYSKHQYAARVRMCEVPGISRKSVHVGGKCQQ